MEIKTVHYSALINLGNYNNEKIGLTASLSDGETVEQPIEALKEKVKENAGINADELYEKQSEARRILAQLEHKIYKAREEWNATAEFLKTQGIKPEAPSMPLFTNLLPEVQEENSSVVDGEFEEQDIDQVGF